MSLAGNVGIIRANGICCIKVFFNRAPKPTSVSAGTSSNSTNASAHSNITARKQKYDRHINSVRIFLAITICAFLAYVPAALAYHLSDTYEYIVYSYFFNHINNPFIYLILNKMFRDDFKVLCNRVK